MSRPVTYVSNGDIRRWNDNEVDRLAFELQTAYANQLNNNGQGRVFISSGNQGRGSASDTARTAIGHPVNFPGTGSRTVNTYYVGQNTSNQGISTGNAPLFWNGAALQKGIASNNGLSDVYNEALNQIRTGNELGSYRVSAGSPGNGWISKGTAFVNTLYNSGQSIPNNIGSTTYTLWLKTGGVTAPGTDAQAIRWDGNDMRRIDITSTNSIMTTLILPDFANWADASLEYRFTTNNINTNKGSFIDTRRRDTRNVQFHTDSYVSYPSGPSTTYQTYYFNVG